VVVRQDDARGRHARGDGGVAHQGGVRTEHHQQIEGAGRHDASELLVRRLGLRPQLAHLSEHRQPPRGRAGGQGVQGSHHRRRVGVVRIVDHGDAVRQALHLHAHAGRLEGLERRAHVVERDAGERHEGGGRQRVGDIVPPGDGGAPASRPRPRAA
jgi:hypothetical protein